MHTTKKERAKAKETMEKILKISIPCVLAIGFVGSIIGTIFASPELKEEEESTSNATKGLIRINKAEYRKQYFAGEHFSFDKETALVTLVAKDPLVDGIVKIDSLPAPEYGFVVGKTIDENDELVDKNMLTAPLLEETPTSEEEASSLENSSMTEEKKYTTTFSEFYSDPSQIVMEKEMGTIYLVSKRYSDLRYALDTEVYSALTEDNLTNDLTFEAEDADLYQDGKFLSEEEKVSKALISNVGANPISEEKAAKLSGGACLRNFSSNNMKVDFVIPASKNCEATIDVKFCARPKGGVFSNFFKASINDEDCEVINSQIVPNGEAKEYFNPTALAPVTIQLKAGFNHISFASGSELGTGSPFNLDAIHLSVAEKCINSLAALA